MRPLSHADHRKFVETEGWEHKGTARGVGKTGDHHRYTLVLADGDVLYTRVSHGPGQIDDPSLVARILRVDLKVSEEDFYRCVHDGVLPPRPKPAGPPATGEAIDATLLRNLVRKVGMSAAQLEGMTKADTVRAWQDYLADGGR